MALSGEAVFVREGKQWVRLPVSEILFMETDDISTHVHTPARKFTVGRIMKDVLVELAH